ncbi:MAG: porin [Planctomycetota bacterium]|nr:porin [Planctomycetota bacterium]
MSRSFRRRIQMTALSLLLSVVSCPVVLAQGGAKKELSGDERLERLEKKLAEQAAQIKRQQEQLDRLDTKKDKPGELSDSRSSTSKPASIKPQSSSKEAEKTKPQYRVKNFGIETLDGESRLQVGLTLTFQGIYSHENRDFDDSFEVRYARVTASGFLEKWIEYTVDLEFGRTAAADLRNAFINLHVVDEVQVKVGQMLMPYSLERLVPIRFLLHPERPIVIFDQVTPFQLGVMVHGSLLEGQLKYAAGFFNGNGANNARDNDERKDFSGRLAYTPFPALTLAVSTILSPSSRGASGPSDVRTLGNQVFRFLDYNEAGNRHDGSRERYSVGFLFRKGPFQVMADGLMERLDELRNSAGVEKRITNYSGYIDVSYLLTGEAKKGSLSPASPFYKNDEFGFGAWELAFRLETYGVDRDILKFGYAVGTDRVIAETLTLNWYPLKGALFALSYTHTEFDDSVRDSGGRKHHGDDSFILRTTIYF